MTGIRCGGFDQCMPTTRPGTRVTDCQLADGDPRGVGGQDHIVADLRLELLEDLLLELLLLGHRLHDEVGAVERLGEIGRVR